MKIIDSQIHIWLPNTPERPWPAGAVSIQGDPHLAEAAISLIDAAGVQAAILVPLSWMGPDNSYPLEAAAKYPSRLAVMGRIDHQAPDAAAQLDRWRDAPGMKGIRLTLHNEGIVPLFNDPAYHWFWAKCEAINLPLMCYMPETVALLAPIAQRHPRLRLIVDHAGVHVRGPKDDAAWKDLSDLLALAKYPNVAVKMSSLPSFSTQPYPFPNLHRHIRAIHDAFGPERMIWGSDVTRLTSTYEENIKLFSEALDFLSEQDKEWIFWRAVTKWCDLTF